MIRRFFAALTAAAILAVGVGTSTPSDEHDHSGAMPRTYYSGGMSYSYGKYVIEHEAARFGMRVRWQHLNGYAAYYQGTNTLLVDPDARRSRKADAKTLIRHEAAHKAIHRKCGTTNPHGRKENVTDAYARQFLGSMSYYGYGFNSWDWNTAWKIKHGIC